MTTQPPFKPRAIYGLLAAGKFRKMTQLEHMGFVEAQPETLIAEDGDWLYLIGPDDYELAHLEAYPITAEGAEPDERCFMAQDAESWIEI